MTMSYREEFRRGWRGLSAASIGLISGYTINLYVANVFAPHLIAEFGWEKSHFAFIGTLSLFGMAIIPIVGRLTDLFGVRVMVAIGVTVTPIMYLALASMNGDFSWFIVLSLLQLMTGAVTSSLVYSRLIAQSFVRSRGKALAIAASAAPAAGAIIIGPLSGLIDDFGWRAGYIAMAAATGLGGAITFLLLPRTEKARPAATAVPSRKWDVYREIVKEPAFRYIAGGMLLCNLTVMVQATQLQILLLDRGLSPGVATQMLSLYAIGVVVGRLSCGLALDRFPTPIVSAITMGAPCIGLALLGFGFASPGVAAFAVLTIGLAMGAELDVLAFIIMRYFKVEIYSTVYGIIQPCIGISQALGSAILGVTLVMTGNFSLFLGLSAVLTLIGSVLFLNLRGCEPDRVAMRAGDLEHRGAGPSRGSQPDVSGS